MRRKSGNIFVFDGTDLGRKEKWRLTAKVTLLNILVNTALLLTVAYLFTDTLVNTLITLETEYEDIKKLLGSFSLPWNKFLVFFEKSMFREPLYEECLYRGIIWIFIVLVGPWIAKQKNKGFASLLVWATIISVTVLWVRIHEHALVFFPLFLTFFFSGITLGWLTAKTKTPWPAIVAHSLMNGSIYLSIKILSFINPSLIP